EMLLGQQTGLKRSFTNASAVRAPSNGTNTANGQSNGVKDLTGLDFSAAEEDKGDDATNFASAAHLSAGWEKGYNQLLLCDQGILYEDAQIQVGLRTEYRGELGCIILHFTNKSSSAIG